MYITINDIIGEKIIDLSYPICSTAGWGKEIAVISMISENTQYEMTKPLKLKLVDGSEKEVLSKTYTSREINTFVEGKHMISDLDNDPQIINPIRPGLFSRSPGPGGLRGPDGKNQG